MKLYVTSNGLDNISDFLITTVSAEASANFSSEDVMEKDYSYDMLDEIIGFMGEWSTATSTRKAEIVAILNDYYATPSSSADDIDKAYADQLKEAWDNSYINPANYSTEQERVDNLIHHDTPVVYPK